MARALESRPVPGPLLCSYVRMRRFFRLAPRAVCAPRLPVWVGALVLLWIVVVSGSVRGEVNAEDVSSVKLRITALDFEVNDVMGTMSAAGLSAVGSAMRAAVEVPLVQSRRFTVVTRVDLEKVLDEVALGAAGVLDPAQAREFGRVAGVDVIVTGTITIISERNYSVTARFIDTETGRIGDSATASRVPGADGFASAGTSFVERVLERYPLQGAIVAIEGDAAFVDVGSERGLAGGGAGVIFRVREVAGRSFPVEVGTFRVVQVAEDLSLIAPSMVAGEVLLVGDRVRFGPPVSASEPLPGGMGEGSPPPVVAAATPEAPDGEPVSGVGTVPSDEVPPLVQAPLEGLGAGSLWVSGSPPSATVLVDGVLVGDLASGSLDVSLPVGDVVVRIEADGFVAQERSVRVESGAATRVVAELVAGPASSGADSRDGVVDQPGGVAGAAPPGTARVVLSVHPPDARVRVDGVDRGHVFDLPPGRYSLVVRAAGHIEEAIDLVVEGSETIEREVVLRREEATLVLDVTPAEARVLLDGGELVERELLLRPGIYQLRVEAPGWVAFERRVVLPAARVERVTVALEPLRGRLMLDLQPPEASVSVDGVDFEGQSLPLPVGVRQVTVSAEGYESVAFEVEITTDGVERRSVQLVARPARVELRVTPSVATVTIDGQPRGAVFELPAGRHEVVVSHPGYTEQRLSLNLAPGDHIERDVTLTRVRIQIQPARVRIAPGGTVEFRTSVAGAFTAVTWEASCGEVSGVGQVGWYTAPTAFLEHATECVVTAAIAPADPRSSAVVTVSRFSQLEQLALEALDLMNDERSRSGQFSTNVLIGLDLPRGYRVTIERFARDDYEIRIEDASGNRLLVKPSGVVDQSGARVQ